MNERIHQTATPIVPAPWQLRGEGYLFLYRFTRGWLLEHGAIPPQLAARFVGGLGALMLVDYQSGTADPYRELLFMPGKFIYEIIGNDRLHSGFRSAVSKHLYTNGRYPGRKTSSAAKLVAASRKKPPQQNDRPGIFLFNKQRSFSR